MTETRLDFTAPADLSVGRVRIANDKGVVGDWIATPGTLAQTSTLAPGYYMAEISPAGVRPQSVVFQVHAGQANTVTLPDFSALAATGGGTTFLDVEDVAAATRSVYAFSPDPALGEVDFEPAPESIGFVLSEADSVADQAERGVVAPKTLSVGLSIERCGLRESWDRFDGACRVQLTGGRLSIDVDAPGDWSPESGRRVRLSVAIEGVRVERLLLPLYRGGTTINLTPSPQSAFDVSLEVIPVDPVVRALWRALEAGTLEHAKAVRDDVIGVNGPAPIAALDVVDPWQAMLAGLLYLRFPEIFGQLDPTWSTGLQARCPWAADAHILCARQIASAVGTTPEDVVASATRTIDLLVRAQVCGAPYFSAANMFFNDLIDMVGAVPGLSPAAKARAEAARRRWQREMPLQRRAGASFSWLSRDQKRLKQDQVLAPNRATRGLLRARDTSILFKGRIAAGTIAIAAARCSAPKTCTDTDRAYKATTASRDSDAAMLPDCPALHRPPGPSDDATKGRFGGQAERDGFALAIAFEILPDPNAVRILIAVEAAASAELAIGDSVWFCLHETFDPQWVKVLFRGRRAALSVTSAGGFTLGAWLPRQQVELELDLAEIPSAPRIVRER